MQPIIVKELCKYLPATETMNYCFSKDSTLQPLQKTLPFCRRLLQRVLQAIACLFFSAESSPQIILHSFCQKYDDLPFYVALYAAKFTVPSRHWFDWWVFQPSFHTSIANEDQNDFAVLLLLNIWLNRLKGQL